MYLTQSEFDIFVNAIDHQLSLHNQNLIFLSMLDHQLLLMSSKMEFQCVNLEENIHSKVGRSSVKDVLVPAIAALPRTFHQQKK